MLCMGLENLGETFVDLNEAANGLLHYREAIAIREKLLAARPDVPDRATAWLKPWSELEMFKGRPRIWPALVFLMIVPSRSLTHARLHDPANRRLVDPLADVLNRRANLYEQSGQTDKSIGLLSRAADLARAALKASPDDSKARGTLTDSLLDLGRLYRQDGRAAEASRSEQERIDLWKNQPADEIVKLALQQAIRANVIGYGKTALSPPGEQARNLDRDHAAADLVLAFDHGFKDLTRLKADPDLAPLLDRQHVQRSGSRVRIYRRLP